MDLQEFQKLALRTESEVKDIKINREGLANLLHIVVGVTELLDGVKKAVFYNKTTKLDEQSKLHIRNIMRATKALSTQTETGPSASAALQAVGNPLDNVNPRVFHGLIGIVTEAGELAAALLKAVEDPAYQIDAVNVQEEMSDIAWYEAILHDAMSLDWEQGHVNVIEKLRIRYPDKYSDYHADNRNLDAERAALEVGFDITAAGFLIPHEGVTDAEFATQIHELNKTLVIEEKTSYSLESVNALHAWPVKTIFDIPVENTCACGKNPACECKEN